jgi:hypothetical protein
LPQGIWLGFEPEVVPQLWTRISMPEADFAAWAEPEWPLDFPQLPAGAPIH